MWCVSRVPDTVGLHQGSALSPLLFVVVLDVFSESVGKEKVVELLHADDRKKGVTEKSGGATACR